MNKWQNAMKEEPQYIKNEQVVDGSVQKHKVRLIVKGYSQ